MTERPRVAPLQILSAELADDFRAAFESVRDNQVEGRIPVNERSPWKRRANRDTFLVIEHERRRLVERLRGADRHSAKRYRELVLVTRLISLQYAHLAGLVRPEAGLPSLDEGEIGLGREIPADWARPWGAGPMFELREAFAEYARRRDRLARRLPESTKAGASADAERELERVCVASGIDWAPPKPQPQPEKQTAKRRPTKKTDRREPASRTSAKRPAAKTPAKRRPAAKAEPARSRKPAAKPTAEGVAAKAPSRGRRPSPVVLIVAASAAVVLGIAGIEGNLPIQGGSTSTADRNGTPTTVADRALAPPRLHGRVTPGEIRARLARQARYRARVIAQRRAEAAAAAAAAAQARRARHARHASPTTASSNVTPTPLPTPVSTPTPSSPPASTPPPKSSPPKSTPPKSTQPSTPSPAPAPAPSPAPAPAPRLAG